MREKHDVELKNNEIRSNTVSSITLPDLNDPLAIKNYYQSIINCMPNNVFWMDKNCIGQGCNENAARLLKLNSPEEFIGMTYEEMAIRTGWTQGQTDSFKKNDIEVMETRKGKFNIEEPPVYDEQGNSFYYMSSKVPLLNLEGEVVGIVGTSIDITERKKNEIALKEAKDVHKFYQKIIGCMPNNVYWLDKNCITLGCNENTLKALNLSSLEEFVGITYEKMGEFAGWTKEQAQSFKRDDMEVIQTAKPKLNVEEPPVYDEKGEPVYYLSSRVPIINEKTHEVEGVVGISVNITPQKKQEQALKLAKEASEVANQAKSYFVASLGHEFRTPLNHIVGFSDILQKKKYHLSQSEQDKYLQDIYQAGNELLDLVNDIIFFTRLEMGHFTVELQDTDLFEIIQKVVRNSAHRIEEKKLEFVIEYPELVSHRVHADPIRVRQVLIHLIDNAIKFTEKGKITLMVDTSGEIIRGQTHIRVSISDSGIGIAEDKKNLIFEKFSQAHTAYDDQRMGRYKGIGLGLAICKELVDLMRGQIGVESIFSEGSTFFFTLPLSKEVQPSIESPVDEVSKQTVILIENKHFLLVEDDKMAARFAQILIEERQHQVDIAKTGQEALELLAKNDYDLVLMDIGLPDMQGTEVVIKYRKTESKGHVPIIALSAQGLEKGKPAAIAAGMDDYLIKPLSVDKLEALLQHWFKNN